MIEKVIRGGICHAIHPHAELTNKYIKYYDKNKELPYLINSDVNNLYVWAMSQTSSVGAFEWVEEMFKFNKDFIKKNYYEDSNRGYFFEINVQYPEKLH